MDERRIEKVAAAIAFMEAHLTEKLDLTRVAAAVHYSKYHLHRLFADTVGLTIHDYAQRRQLTEAAKLLAFSNKPILEIAAAAGYESQQAFTNIFTAMYKQSPRKYRENERFYPLQLRFQLEGDYAMLRDETASDWEITLAREADIPCTMALVRLVVDGFPHLQEASFEAALRDRIQSGQAYLMKDGPTAVGVLLFSKETGSIDFLGTHPLYRKKGIPRAFLDKVLRDAHEISITTFRAGDKADTGHRRAVQALGFAEAELLVEFGYPTQRFMLPREAAHDN